jgi:hypothetical protein
MACTVSVDQFHGKIKTKFSPRSPGGRPPRGPAPCTTVVRTFGLTRNSYCSYSNPVVAARFRPAPSFTVFDSHERGHDRGQCSTCTSAGNVRMRIRSTSARSSATSCACALATSTRRRRCTMALIRRAWSTCSVSDAVASLTWRRSLTLTFSVSRSASKSEFWGRGPGVRRFQGQADDGEK